MVVNLATKATLAEIRKSVEGLIGERVILKTNKGKRKANVREGILEVAYPSVFTVRINAGLDTERRVSFSYSDILTDTVEVTLCQRVNVS
ncbi:MAG: Veg protein [Acidaminobacter sp.]|jgi:uncharacterized protein Veg|nr:Veg protein [Acidaminobacter sp.]MZQ99320.1 Veg protein [Acidaminobacter sp.]